MEPSDYDEGVLDAINMIADELEQVQDMWKYGYATSKDLKKILTKVARAKSRAFRMRSEQMAARNCLN